MEERPNSAADFEAFVHAHQQRVYAVALRMLGNPHEAEEIAQDAFVRAFQSLDGFRGESSLGTWVIAIAMNLCRNRRRGWLRRKQVIAGSLDEPLSEDSEETRGDQTSDTAPGPEEIAARRERERLLLEALQQLDSDHRSVVVLRDLHGMDYAEIAKALECPEGTVKSRLSRARLALRGILQQNGWLDGSV